MSSIKKASIINALGRYTKVLLSILVEVILARLLTPHDYGIVAVVVVFTTFFTTLSDMGLSTAIVQNKTLDQSDLNSIFAFTVYISVVLMVFFYFFSYVISFFYDSNVYVKIGKLLSIALFFNCLNMVPNGILNRQKRFVDIAIRTVVVYLIASIVTIIFAILGARYYSLVVQAILTALFTFVWNFVTSGLKFKLTLKIDSLKKVASYSSFQFGFNFLNYFSRNLDNLLAGKFIGSTQLGYYNKAYTLMQYPVSNLSGVVTPVLHPILSDFQNNKKILFNKYIAVVKLLLIIGIWAEAICIFAAPEIIKIMYGSNWGNSVFCFQLLSMSIATQMVNSSSGAAFQALGDTKRLFIQGLLNTLITVIAIIIGVFSGRNIYALAIWVSLSFIINFIVSFYFLMSKSFEIELAIVFKMILPYLAISLSLGALIFVYPFGDIRNVILSLLCKIIYSTAMFLLSFCVFDYRELKSFVKNKL